MLISSWLNNFRSAITRTRTSTRRKSGRRRSVIRSGYAKSRQYDTASRTTEALENRALLSVTVLTDALEYEDGDVATIVASGFDVGETVEFTMHDTTNDLPMSDPSPVIDGGSYDLDGVADGSIQLKWPVDTPGLTLEVTATATSTSESDAAAFEVAPEDFSPPAVTVSTDKEDYQPSDTAIITATGFTPGETVELLVLHIDDTANTGEGHDPWSVTDGSSDDLDGSVNGSVQTSWFVNPDDSLDSIFQVTATGQSSGNTGDSQFTDGYYATRFYDAFNSGTASSSYWEYRDVESGSGYINFDANDRELRSKAYSFSS